MRGCLEYMQLDFRVTQWQLQHKQLILVIWSAYAKPPPPPKRTLSVRSRFSAHGEWNEGVWS
jgi:hypothetical protein